MKTALIYYSHSGRTQILAQKLSTALEADTASLQPSKPLPQRTFAKYLVCGYLASKQKALPVEALELDVEKYDLLILGMPVWAGKMNPVLRGYLQQLAEGSLKGKKVAIFCSYYGSDGAALSQTEAELEELGAEVIASKGIAMPPKLQGLPDGFEQWVEELRQLTLGA